MSRLKVSLAETGLNNLIAARRAPMADHLGVLHVWSNASAHMNAGLDTLHAPEAAAEVVDD
jgi:hypothetical protein